MLSEAAGVEYRQSKSKKEISSPRLLFRVEFATLKVTEKQEPAGNPAGSLFQKAATPHPGADAARSC